MSRSIELLVVALALSVSAPVMAASEEIQVYLDDLTPRGRFGSDLHTNYVLSGPREPEYSGALPSHHLFRFTPEFYYGLTETVELGLYLLTTVAPGAVAHYEGEKLRLKYIAPHDEQSGSFWGVNLEVGKTGRRVSEVPWNAQLKGIYGFRSGPWTVGFNANLDGSLAGSPASPVSLEFDTKVAYEARRGLQIGFESYNELGPLRDLGRLNTLSQMLYGVIDAEVSKKVGINAGIGRGLNAASDRWVAKVIVGIQY